MNITLQLSRRSDLHLARKAFHMTGGALLLYFLVLRNVDAMVISSVLTGLLTIVLIIELLRKNFPAFNQFTVRFNQHIIRKEEVDGITGIPFYLASCLIAVLIFPFHIAVLSILYLALGDPSSSFFGVLYGRDSLFENKSLQGTLGGFLVCSLSTAAYLLYSGAADGKVFVFSVMGGLAGSIAEMLPLNIDDNFSIPIVSGCMMWIVFWSADLLY